MSKAKSDRSEFVQRYEAILETAARHVRVLVGRGQRYVTAEQIATWIARDLPTLYKNSFPELWRCTPLPMKVWRVKTLLSNAVYLGAFSEMGVRAVRGRGLTLAERPQGKLRAA